MERQVAERRLDELWTEIRDLRSTEDLLQWDQETYMPPGALAARSRMLSTLAALKHRLLVAPELREVLDACADFAEEGSALAGAVRCARLDVDRAVRVPETLVRDLAVASSEGLAAWQEARRRSEFSLFEKPLARLFDLRRQEAAAVEPEASTYDAMLHHFEPGASEADLAPVFEALGDTLRGWIRTVADHGTPLDEGRIRAHYPVAQQEAFGRDLARAIGFDFEAGRLDASSHPFCTAMDPRDVRMTWRWMDDDFRSAVFGILHETGHGLYEQGLPQGERRSPGGDAVSLGIHESQSRLWENHVGRSLGFWRFALGSFRERFPDAPTFEAEELWPLLHTVEPSFIRVEADEATYNLHVIIRFEIERALCGGDLTVADLPAAWDDLYEKYLGIRADNAAQGVLQDIHWSMGMFGYFPTYTLGTLAAAQLFDCAKAELGDLEAAFERGEFQPLLSWLREKIHRHGGRYPAPELLERATGQPLSSEPLLAYLKESIEGAYPGVELAAA